MKFFRGEAVPSKTHTHTHTKKKKTQQSIDIKSFYQNSSSGFENKKTV